MRTAWELAADVVVTVEDVLADLEPAALASRPDRAAETKEPQ